jgi:hypothetical protein
MVDWPGFGVSIASPTGSRSSVAVSAVSWQAERTR